MRGPSRLSILVAVLVVVITACTAGDGSRPDDTRDDGAIIELTGLNEHLMALSDIASRAGGTRASGTAGYDDSVAYVVDRLEAAGYDVETQRFEFPFFGVDEDASVVLAGKEGYREGADFKTMVYSSSGEVEAMVVPLRFDPRARGRDGPGCTPDTYETLPAGAIVLLRPGPCLFRDQVEIAQDASAAAVIFAFPEFDDGFLLRPTLISPDTIDIPVLAGSDSMGRGLARLAGERIRVVVETMTEMRPTQNVIAETPSGDPDDVLILGGHLDSVIDGPGINDNGSGTAALLEVAEEMQGVPMDRKVRFAFWAAEEFGLLGSTHYVAGLEISERDDIHAYLNFDMVGSPNYVRYMYSDDGAPEGSAGLHELFADYFEAADIEAVDIDLQGRSDHGPFIQAGIPVSGLFTGADMVKSAEEARSFGGEPGAFEDPCYHQACDDIDNLSGVVLRQMAGAMAHVVTELAAK